MRILTLLLFPALLLAQAPSEPPKKARIEGSVTSITGEPVPRAAVRLQGATTLQNNQPVQSASYAATAGDDGKFVIEEIEPGLGYVLTAQRPGFVTTRYGARGNNAAGAPIVLEPGRVLSGVTIQMTPQGVLSGHITDAVGDPVQGVAVTVLRRGYQLGVRQMVTVNLVNTNDQGEYRVANLPPGRYFLMAAGVNLVQALTATAGSSTTPVPTYYPNATDERGAAPIDLAPGQELRGVDIRLQMGRSFRIRGKLNPAVTGAQVLAVPDSGNSVGGIPAALLASRAMSQPDGSFDLRGVTPGNYVLQAVTSTVAPTRAVGRMPVHVVDQDLVDVSLPVGPGVTVNGTVRLENGDLSKLLPPAANQDPAAARTAAALAVAASNSSIAVNGARIAIALTSVTPGASSGVSLPVADDGSFTVEGLAPAEFSLTVAALPSNVYIKSARFGGLDAIRNQVDLRSGAGGPLEIVLAEKAAAIRGTVRPERDASPAGVLVSLWSREPEGGMQNNGVRMFTADQNGGFRFEGLRPGVYFIAAWEDIDNGLAQARDFLSLLASEATRIELSEGSAASADVAVVPVAKIKAAEEKLP